MLENLRNKNRHMSDSEESLEPLKIKEIKSIIRQLNQMDLDRTDYVDIKNLINSLIIGIPLNGMKLSKDTRLYRGIKYKEKPLKIDQLTYPPIARTINFQRCNQPFQPMFYCSLDPSAVFYELNVQAGDNIYLTRWSIKNDFFILQIAPNEEDSEEHPERDIIFTFFETKFSQPIHETYSSQYKITSAIADHMSFGYLSTDDAKAKAILADNASVKIGAISYPSVSHPGRSTNFAIRPATVDSCLQLDYVEEIKVVTVKGKEISFTSTNLTSHFSGAQIEWPNKGNQLTIPPNSSAALTITKEPDGYIISDGKGNIIKLR